MKIECTVEEFKKLTSKDLQDLKAEDIECKKETPIAVTIGVQAKKISDEIANLVIRS